VFQYYGLDWIGTILGLASIYYIGRRNTLALVLRIAASVFWTAFGVMARTPAGIVANVIAILLCLRGMEVWRLKGRTSAGLATEDTESTERIRKDFD